ncbi:glycosyltransferase family 2 protein [Echinicola vietnamensis]|uniref:Putative glycosyltransferase n=1 Tax=Echinicola vietnamensis (strain DSM 17526 / LMG 23754 / KMM 6221) TaxID=926556 RepID=L0G0A3_ECHVK|nr:glycosyltransferase [Echinicola vietnamensis]AGA78977.1 putative glycosyltransferase [Echinicola vietnamensis DSM 17526]
MREITEIDIIILSYAKDPALKEITENALKSLNESENNQSIKFNTIVIESEKKLRPYQYPKTKTIYPKQNFGYHKYMNIGIKMTQSEFVCICNNDLVFHKGWASEILQAFEKDPNLSSASPACSIHHPDHGIAINSGIHIGYEVRKELVGWCLFFKRDMLKVTGKLDPKFKFWFADNDYSMTLQEHGLKHALVASSIVDHLESKTLNTKSDKEKWKLTVRERFYYEYKWEGRSFLSYMNRLRKFK